MTKVVLTMVASVLLALSMQVAEAAPRTFVSGSGGGATCTRAAPCATFQAAHDVTDAGGEINCVDAGDYGGVTITKSITIDCAGTVGGISGALVATAVTINTASVVVRLRNLTLNGMLSGNVGVRFNNGAALFVENCVIANFNSGAVGDGIGIRFAPPAGVTAELYVTDSIITSNGRGSDGGGIIIQPAGTGSARVAIERTRIENNTYGFFANGSGSTGVIAVQIRDSVSSDNVNHGISAFTAAGQSTTSITVERSSAILNGADGILAQGSPAFVLLADSTVMSNVLGLAAVSGGNILTYQDNQLTGNVTDGAPTATLTVK
jgi:parallel beta helix pectate lyase-like protein